MLTRKIFYEVTSTQVIFATIIFNADFCRLKLLKACKHINKMFWFRSFKM